MNSHPNILLFLTDDHGPWTLPFYGNHELKTPHFSALAKSGTMFRNAFTPCPVCSPARACLMTGQPPSQVGIHDWLEEAAPDIGGRDWLGGEATLPQLLRNAGYHTLLSGKWHLGRSHQTPPGFDRCFGIPGYQGKHNGIHTYHQDGEPVTLEGNKSGHITDRALEMLKARPAGRPFFLNVGYIATHSPYRADMHDPALVAETAGFSFEDIPEYRAHPWVKNEGLGEEASRQREDLKSLYEGYYAAVLELDLNVGRIVAFLKDEGLLENTLIVYVSDHGCSLGQNGFFGKGNSTRPLNMAEVSLRVPLIMSGPGVRPGGVVTEAVDHYDLFLALAGRGGAVLPERNYPGRSLAPLAAGETVADWPEERFGEYGDLRMIRTADYKFVKRYPSGPDDLYDLKNDPEESRNLAESPDHAALRRSLEERLACWYVLHDDPIRSGLQVKKLPRHNLASEAWRDGRREARGLQKEAGSGPG